MVKDTWHCAVENSILQHLQSRQGNEMQILTITAYSILYSIFNVLGASIIKTKLNSSKVSSIQDFAVFLLNAPIILAICFIVMSMYFSIKALSISDFSSAIPYMTGFNFILTLAVGLMYFKERLNIVGYVGILTIFIGIALVSMGYTTQRP